MRISIDTEREEIEEIRHAIAILEDALKRREDSDAEYEEEDDSEEDMEEDINESGTFEEQEESPKYEEKKETFTPPQAEMQPPKPQMQAPSFTAEREARRQTQPDVDMSALTMKDHGSSTSRPSESMSYHRPAQDNKSAVKNIISDLRNRSHGQPIQMSAIVSLAREKNISEQETKNLVSELQREGAI